MHWVLFYTSIKLSNVSIGLICLSSVALFTVLLDPLFTKKKIQWQDLMIALISLLGILFIFQFDIQTALKLNAVYQILKNKSFELTELVPYYQKKFLNIDNYNNMPYMTIACSIGI